MFPSPNVIPRAGGSRRLSRPRPAKRRRRLSCRLIGYDLFTPQFSDASDSNSWSSLRSSHAGEESHPWGRFRLHGGAVRDRNQADWRGSPLWIGPSSTPPEWMKRGQQALSHPGRETWDKCLLEREIRLHRGFPDPQRDSG
jgi:hypothetical protein